MPEFISIDISRSYIDINKCCKKSSFKLECFIHRFMQLYTQTRLRVFNVLSSKWQNVQLIFSSTDLKAQAAFLITFYPASVCLVLRLLVFFCLTACPSLIFLHFLLLVHARTTGSNQISHEFAISNDSYNEILSMVLWNSL